MTPPPLRTRALGHPVVAWPMAAVTAFACYRWTQDLNAGFAAIGLLLALAPVMRANDAMRRYQAWQREWDAMGEPALPRHNPWRQGGACIITAAIILYAVAHADQPAYRFAVGWMIAVAGIAALVAILRRWRRRAPRANRHQPLHVILAVRGPLLPVPPLAHAYAALPDHCRRLLGGQ